jgi:hypothetical protein
MAEKHTPRPIRISFLAICTCLLSLWYGLRLIEAIRFWQSLSAYQVRPGPAYIAATGGFWLLAGIACAWGLWSGKLWGWWGSIAAAVGYVLWYWFDRLVFQYPHSNWPFTLTVSMVGLAVFLLILLSSTTVRFFHTKREP